MFFSSLSQHALKRKLEGGVDWCTLPVHEVDILPVQRMTVKEASKHFGISPDGVRQRIRRGNLESEHGGDGRVYVWVDTSVQNADSVGERSTSLEDELRERIASLERQLERRDEELQRAHQLLGESLSQLRALNAPEVETTEGYERHKPPPESAHEGPGPAGGTPQPEAQELSSRLLRGLRRWWRSGSG